MDGAAPLPAPVTFTVPGDPCGKGRARSFVRGGHVGHYTPEKTRTYEGIVRSLAMDAMENKIMFECPVHVEVLAIFAIPKSYSNKQRADAMAGALMPAKKPDASNILKAIEDAINAVVFRDDAQIVSLRFRKSYGPQAMVVCTVRPA